MLNVFTVTPLCPPHPLDASKFQIRKEEGERNISAYLWGYLWWDHSLFTKWRVHNPIIYTLFKEPLPPPLLQEVIFCVRRRIIPEIMCWINTIECRKTLTTRHSAGSKNSCLSCPLNVFTASYVPYSRLLFLQLCLFIQNEKPLQQHYHSWTGQ